MEPVTSTRKPGPRGWIAYGIGRTGFRVAAVMLRQTNQIRAELYIAGSEATAFFHLLREQQTAIENELGYSLVWEELPEKRDCRISCYLSNVDPEDSSEWPRQHAWLAERINDLHRVFAPRVRTLDADAWQPED